MVQYSICSLVTKETMYAQMKQSFQQNGFTNDTEFLSIDNTQQNNGDGYSGLHQLVAQAKGKYIICCHQDIVMYENARIRLDEKLREMDKLDPNWAVLSNCGGNEINQYALCVTGPTNEVLHTNNFPFKAKSFDEHFILIKKESGLNFSTDLEGFHFYGTDICLQAIQQGIQPYCIDYMMKHFGGGTMDASFYACKNRLIKKYEKIHHFGWIQTTCYRVYISTNKLKNRLFNIKKISYLRKKYLRFAHR